MPVLHAQPYDLDAIGFHFESVEEFQIISKRHMNAHWEPVEEYEIQFIDGDDIDCVLAKAWSVDQANIGGYFKACEDWDDHEKRLFIIAVDECGYAFDPKTVRPSDFDIDIYDLDSMTELAEQFVDEGLFGDIPERLTRYIDMDAIARDLAQDYSETKNCKRTAGLSGGIKTLGSSLLETNSILTFIHAARKAKKRGKS